ncbi:hypothetical protein [Agrococcus sp. ProA11]|uniref:hypothetical protein n=1 Tax=Agrococcus chionoecetis TaxID=3153752 RepID=UPI0032612503
MTSDDKQPAEATGHIRYGGRNYNAPAREIEAVIQDMKTAQPGSSRMFSVDDGNGPDFLFWTFGAPISFHMWEAPTHNN